MAIESGIINVRYPYFAIMKKEDTANSKPEYDTPFLISEATTVGRAPTVQNVPAWADGITVESFSGSTGGSLTLGIHALSLENYQKIYGAKFDKNGVLISSSDDTPPYGAFMFESQKGNGNTMWTVLYKVKFQPVEATVNTKTETVTWQQPTLNATYMARMDFWVDEDGKRHNHVFSQYDEENPNFDRAIADAWYTKVYEPITPGETVLVTKVTLNKNTIDSLAVGATELLKATVEPENATDTTINWTSSDDAIATVTETGLVEGISPGPVTITATNLASNIKGNCAVTVTTTSGDKTRK